MKRFIDNPKRPNHFITHNIGEISDKYTSYNQRYINNIINNDSISFIDTNEQIKNIGYSHYLKSTKYLQRTKYIPIDYIISEKKIGVEWDWNLLSKNRYMTMDIIRSHLDLPWNWGALMQNPNIDVNFYLKYKKKFDSASTFTQIFENKNIDIVKLYPHVRDTILKSKTESFMILFDNLHITIDFVMTYLKDLDPIIGSYRGHQRERIINRIWLKISSNPAITMKMIEEHPDLPWDYYYGISENPNLTAKFFEKHITEPWNINRLIHNQYFIGDVFDKEIIRVDAATDSKLVRLGLRGWRRSLAFNDYQIKSISHARGASASASFK